MKALRALHSVFRRFVSPEFGLRKGSFVPVTAHFGGGVDVVDEMANIVIVVYCDGCEAVREIFMGASYFRLASHAL